MRQRHVWGAYEVPWTGRLQRWCGTEIVRATSGDHAVRIFELDNPEKKYRKGAGVTKIIDED